MTSGEIKPALALFNETVKPMKQRGRGASRLRDNCEMVMAAIHEA